jgi:hypothetical protein
MIYSGGDDVLAMLPASNAFDCGLALHYAFQGHLPEECPANIRRKLNELFEFKNNGFVRCIKSSPNDDTRPNWPLMVPGKNATVSIGIAVGHVKSPMQDVIKAAREAEKEAKQVPDKGALCLRIRKRSGESSSFSAKLNSTVLMLWAELNGNENKLSNRFAYRYCQLIRPLLLHGNEKNASISQTWEDHIWAQKWDQDLLQAVQAELCHTYYQQNESGMPSNKKHEKAIDRSSHWIKWLIGGDLDKPVLKPRDFLHFWMAWAFMNRISITKGEID